MAFQSTTKFLPGSRWFLGSLEFLTDTFGDLSLQEPELSEVTRSGTSCLPPTSVRFGLVNEAQLEHRLGSLGDMDTDPIADKGEHNLAILIAAADPIYQPSSVSDSKYDREVYMVEQCGELLEKTAEEIQREAEEGIARIERFARELDKRKWHNGLQDDSGAWRTSIGMQEKAQSLKFESKTP
jgi:hypothetical protein